LEKSLYKIVKERYHWDINNEPGEIKMTNKERSLIKNKILKCLTEDFKNNQAIFDKKEGYQIFCGTDLNMVMDAVVKGIEMVKYELKEAK
jgi:hypothetical protein